MAQDEAGHGDRETIGSRLRHRRQAKRLTLREVADQAGLSEGFLSQLERDVHTGSVATLQRITEVLGLSVGDLFEETWSPTPTVHHFSDRDGYAFGDGARKARLTPKQFQHLEVFLGVLDPHGSTGAEPYAHGDSEEVLLVIEGDVEVTIGGATHRMGPYDSITYSSTSPHRVRNLGETPARVVWTIGPPSY